MKKILSLILALLMILSMVFYAVNAAETKNAEINFSDVKSNDYFASAVDWAVEKGVTTGTSETTFSPYDTCTRAQAVTFLWRANGMAEPKTTTNPFVDVKENDYFYKAVLWAVEQGITSGTSETTFEPETTVSREMFVTFLWRYVNEPWYDNENVFVDVNENDYFYHAVIWATLRGITTGIDETNFGTGEACLRCQTVTFLFRYFGSDAKKAEKQEGTPLDSVKINGTDISKFVIAYDNDGGVMANAAAQLQKYIKATVNVELDINVGPVAKGTKRIYIKNETIKDSVENYAYKSDDDGIVIMGAAKRGAIYGVFQFLEKELGWRFVAANSEACLMSGSVDLVNLDVEYEQFFEMYRSLYITETYDVEFNAKRMINGTPIINMPTEWGDKVIFTINGCHTLANLMEDPAGGSLGENVCLLNESNYQKIKSGVLKILSKNPDSIVSVSQNDNSTYCKCSECQAAYDKYGTTAATFILTCNRLCEETQVDYPNSYIETFAYEWTRTPPKGLTCNDRLIIYIAPIDACYNHAMNDPNCSINKELYEDVIGWGKVCNKIYVWDYSAAFKCYLCPFPELDVIRQNTLFFYENNVEGYFMQGLGGQYSGVLGEYAALRSYLIAKTFENPYMTEQEYNTCIDDFVKVYYGSAAPYIRKYIDLTLDLSNGDDTKHWIVFDSPETIYCKHPFELYNDQLIEWFAKAEELADNDLILEHIQHLKISCEYLRLGSVHRAMYTKGTTETKAQYKQEAEALFNLIKKFGIAELADGVKVPSVVTSYSMNVRNWGGLPYTETK